MDNLKKARGNYTWEHVDVLAYKEDESPFKSVTRQVLSKGAYDLPVELRYFEVGVGGYSTLERHRHTHIVMIYRGKGHCLLGDKVLLVEAGDVLTVPSMMWHQFKADMKDCLGFLCLVDRDRDKVMLPTKEDIETLSENEAVKQFLQGYHFKMRHSRSDIAVRTYQEEDGHASLEYCTSWESLGAYVGVTLQEGGYSKGEYAGLNMGLHVGDDIEDVIKNRTLALKVIDRELSEAVFLDQVHGTNIVRVGKEAAGRGTRSYEDAIPCVDAAHTNDSDIVLAICVADCLPVAIFDPVKKVVAGVHAGWRGIKGDIVRKTIEEMERVYDSKREDCLVYIGPCIGRESFTVDEALGREFQEMFGYDVYDEARGSIDLVGALYHSLVPFGVRMKHITTSNRDTYRDEATYSYRRCSGKTGRMAMLVSLLKE